MNAYIDEALKLFQKSASSIAMYLALFDKDGIGESDRKLICEINDFIKRMRHEA